MSSIDPNTQVNNTDSSITRTLYQKLLESSHPIALLSFIILRLSPIAIYIFGMIFTSNYILFFILIILLIAADFWNVKNISGRLLVGLRWWNETNDLGSTIWVFENADQNRYINPIDSKMFWLLMYTVPIVWGFLAILALLKLQLLSLILVIIAISLSLTNTMAYTKCDKFGKANSIASGIFSSVSANMFSNFNPLARFFPSTTS
ncbi:Tvp23 protein [Pichia kluyveri]|uniref:Golgi apparatus membrane protein TVP23 n=1 Tax=Pichia kluyveri TaxID=36015 RepID=A0AAV5R4J2_PICKL|nr:Tvp23 protein [Pichia kluyveri]